LEKDSSGNDEPTNEAVVDFWVVRAVPVNKPASSSENDSSNNIIGPAFATPHRRLGDSTINLRYASRVTYDQLSTAVQCLIHQQQQ
jgi:hypothetical protein